MLFHKLGRYIGISTVTGDFYDLSPEIYGRMESWNKKISFSRDPFSRRQAEGLAGKYGIPPEVNKLFPLPSQKTSFSADKNASRCLTDLTLNLTSSCNLRCVYCWNDHGKYSNRKFTGKQEGRFSNNAKNEYMLPETALRAVDILVASRGKDKDLVVDFYGGEPLMNLDTLRATVNYCRKNQSKWGVTFHFLLATNGTFLTPDLAKELIDQGVQIAVSIDGPMAVHDHNRPLINQKGSFNLILSNLKKMPAAVMKRLVGRTTVTPFFPDMVKLYENLRRLGFERIELFESEDACHRFLPGQEASFFSSAESYALLCKTYEKLALKYIDDVVSGNLNYSKTFFNRFFKLMQRLYYNHEVSGGCPAAKGQIAVGIDGKIYPCTSFLGVSEFELGDTTRGIDSRKFKAFIKKISRRFEYCRKDCELFSLCRSTGSCLNVNYFFSGDPAVPHKRSCELFAEKLSLAAASLAILSDKIPQRLEELFGFDPIGRRGNKLY
ncbi:MAG: radical SAM protein [Candidatus Omnitrophica bacterium]|nr:radical SAM protein [Candidatus Omnitrophota bacterium]